MLKYDHPVNNFQIDLLLMIAACVSDTWCERLLMRYGSTGVSYCNNMQSHRINAKLGDLGSKMHTFE